MSRVTKIFGENLASLLDSEEKQRAALDIHDAVEQKKGADAAREWMIVGSPALMGAAPIKLIGWGCFGEVAHAAHEFIGK